MSLSELDKKTIRDRYKQRYIQHGVSQKALGWDKGKQKLRFKILTSSFLIENNSILDIGCGFGDLYNYLEEQKLTFTYTGVELVEELFKEAQLQHNISNAEFIYGEFSDLTCLKEHDYVIGSGIFNYEIETGNYLFIEQVIRKAYEICKIGFAFNFLSDQIDYKDLKSFYTSPFKILEVAYSYSRNIIFRNDYMPFEFTIIVFKNDTFSKTDTIFDLYKLRDKQIKDLI